VTTPTSPRAHAKAFYRDELVTVYHGDCLEVLAQLPAQSAHAVVTDPPYGLEFMGHDWDRPWAVSPASRATFAGRDLRLPIHRDNRNANCRACGGRQRGKKRCRCTTPQWDRDPHEDMIAFQVWCQHWACACLRVLRPGGHLIAFGGTRTWHRLACALEDAGFDIRDTIAWLYATGFPKNLNISQAVTKASNARPEATDRSAATLAQYWNGWGTALKPGFEPIVVARKPLAGTVAETVLAYGTGGLNIDATRIAYEQGALAVNPHQPTPTMGENGGGMIRPEQHGQFVVRPASGRWPTNVVLTHAPACTTDSEVASATRCVPGCPVADLDRQGDATSGAGHRTVHRRAATGAGTPQGDGNHRSSDYPGDPGGASRFFPTFRWQPKARASQRPSAGGVTHPTVKPVDLMRWLVCLVTPPDGTIVDPFLGSGTTAEAARAEGFRCIGIERDPSYLPLITTRLRGVSRNADQDTQSRTTERGDIAA
jgi:site-specific DNA-methyltransferase (adenine-specific)